MTDEDLLILVDEKDEPVGVGGKHEVHARALRHRAVSVLLRHEDGRLLLQRRAVTKYHSAGLWSNACCGHPRPGEAPADAARRRLREEMGIAVPLRFDGKFHYNAALSGGLVENEIVHLYCGWFSGSPDPCAEEVEDWEFVDPARLVEDVRRHPERYTAWFRLYLEAMPRLLAPEPSD
jgi:isopentenyl-diphosphate Delta-isomerase